jgi:RNA polymerase sigma factor (sigma-70 family)
LLRPTHVNIENEEALLDQILAGDSKCFALLVDKYKNYAYTISYKILQNRSEAEEASQDSFVKAYHHLKDFNRQSKFSTWLYRIVFNTSISQKRKTRYRFESIEKSIIEHPPLADQLEKNDKERFVAKALERLNELDKLCLQLFYLKEFSLEEIAIMMDQTPSNVKVRVHRARIKVANELTKILKEEALTL